jgi:small GTP-binding protein
MQNQHTFDSEYDYLYKCVLCGEAGTGKSQFANIFSNRPFTTNLRSTIGVEFSNRIITVKNKKLKMQLWDTSSNERYRAVPSAYYKGCVLTFLFFDLNNKRSFENLNKWIEEIKCYSDPNTLIVLIGNKCDLIHHVPKEEIDNFLQNNNCNYYYEISCKSNPEKILDLLNDVAYDLLDRTENTHIVDYVNRRSYLNKIRNICISELESSIKRIGSSEYNKEFNEELRKIEVSRLKSEINFLYFCLFFIISVLIARYLYS